MGFKDILIIPFLNMGTGNGFSFYISYKYL